MAKISLKPINKEIEYINGENLMTVLIRNQAFLNNPCNGKGTCGKCKVIVKSEGLASLTPEEEAALSADEIHRGYRLACMIDGHHDMAVTLVDEERQHRILTTGKLPYFKFEPLVIRKTLSDSSINHQTESIYHGDRLVEADIESAQGVYGIALDIGTTTMVGSLVNLESGEELGSSSMINPQKNYGLDVLTRISYVVEEGEEGLSILHNILIDGINEMITDLCQTNGINRSWIYEVTVAANTTMLHLLVAEDVRSLGRSPYKPIFTEMKYVGALDIGIKIHDEAVVCLLPSVSAFIGSDIVGGVLVADMMGTEESVLFIDIGTNGEMVLSKSGDLFACSCAAGPALEGMNIEYGMRARKGAIEDVLITSEGIELKVIGDAEPEGLCGSGILSVVSELIKTRLIKSNGTFIKLENLEKDDEKHDYLKLDGKKRVFHMGSLGYEIEVSQKDVRQVQLAKGAILSGVVSLLDESGISVEELDRVVIAGQFGAHLPADRLITTGILPEVVSEKIDYIGNSSKSAAYMALMSRGVRQAMKEISLEIKYVELSTRDGYDKLFAKCLRFE